MSKYQYIAPCHFGLESVLKQELKGIGLWIESTEDGRVYFSGDESALARANIFLRTAERVLLMVGTFEARSFDELFEGVKRLPWEEYVPKDGCVLVKKAASVRSKLFSPSDIQSIVKKAIVDRLMAKYGFSGRLPESGADFPLRVFINKDRVTIGLDTTGESLHKRGYRKKQGEAPIAENLAAALILLSKWTPDKTLIDPFCGSGTIPIEAALIAKKMAPGRNRDFAAADWGHIIKKRIWYAAYDEAESQIIKNVDLDIRGYDIDGTLIRVAQENADMAEVEDLIHLERRPVSELGRMEESDLQGTIITNPPYGERMTGQREIERAYMELGDGMERLGGFDSFVITGFPDAERFIGRRADKNRKIYNGMIKTYFLKFGGRA